ncbi:hypothetical protein AKJ64_02855 [candidate division MSBL1 archaeon SCGC-AAA259E17]|uniref:PIN domain-containing protein n=1 Tax=candidate division MSBL1 archaeon SCGC-AAA259E17 TaxID=1698263 RepID=A0A133UEF0_9EURY|nr:hypothetical protein AKJ64_02855 [candidate division MSBL1 archaeon SCGC-AAA259E17]
MEHEFENYSSIYEIIYNHQFSSQDALIIFTALQENITYFLSNDADIVNQINQNGLMHAYSLRDEVQREDFESNVLMNLEVDEE